MRRWSWLAAALAISWASPAAAETASDRARALFNAGAAAYKMGDFLAAAQAFQKAHDAEPRAGLVFSVAQALRRHYVAEGDAQHARLAIKYYRDYLDQVPTGGRRLEAAQAVSELTREVGAEGGGAMVFPTRLMVTSPTPGAVVQIDGGPVLKLPFNDRIEPGPHTVTVMASGYQPAERKIEAKKGDIVPLDLALVGKAPLLEVEGADGADVMVDGKPIGEAPFAKPLEVAPGPHFVTIEERGHKAYGEELVFEHGARTTIEVDLPATNQRRAAYGVLVVGGVLVAGAAVQAGLAFVAQKEALDIEEAQKTRNISQTELERHNGKLAERDRLAVTGGATAGLGVAVLATGFLLYVFDEPEVISPAGSPREGPAPEAMPAPADEAAPMEISALPLLAPTFIGLGAQGRF